MLREVSEPQPPVPMPSIARVRRWRPSPRALAAAVATAAGLALLPGAAGCRRTESSAAAPAQHPPGAASSQPAAPAQRPPAAPTSQPAAPPIFPLVVTDHVRGFGADLDAKVFGHSLREQLEALPGYGRRAGLSAGALEEVEWRISREFAREHFSTTKAFMDLLALKPGMAVLDIGASTGQLAMGIAERLAGTGYVFATDTKPLRINYVIDRARERHLTNLHGAVVKADGLDPVYRTRTYDLIVVSNTALTLMDAKLFGKLRPLLKPGGRLIIRQGYGRPRYPPFEPDDFKNPRAFLAELAREPAGSPFAQALSPAIRARLKTLAAGAPDPTLLGAVIKEIDRALADPAFGKSFVRGARFVNERFPTGLEKEYATWLLMNVKRYQVHERIRPLWWKDDYSRRLNNRLFVRRFGAFLHPRWSSPAWPGRTSPSLGSERQRITETLARDGWTLQPGARDVSPYHFVLVYRLPPP